MDVGLCTCVVGFLFSSVLRMSSDCALYPLKCLHCTPIVRFVRPIDKIAPSLLQGIDPDPSSNSGFMPARALFAFFPTYRSSPLPATWDRIVHAGDASGIQSPLSFGGFGALSRHLARITGALGEALELEEHDEHSNALGAKSLSRCNPYMPNLAVKLHKRNCYRSFFKNKYWVLC